MTVKRTIAENVDRYQEAAHAMQTGVAFTMGKEVEPKHLRVGVNSAMSDHGALVRLLVAKGILTEEEYIEAIADAMEAEAESYREKLGPNVKLA